MADKNFKCEIRAGLHESAKLTGDVVTTNAFFEGHLDCQSSDLVMLTLSMLEHLINEMPEHRREAYKESLIEYLKLPEGLSPYKKSETRIEIGGNH